MQTPRIVTKGAFQVLGLEIETTPGSPEISALWGRYDATDHSFHKSEPGTFYGVMQLEQRTLRYMAGEALLDGYAASSALTRWAVPASKYAVFTADLSNVSNVFAEAYGQWLPQSGMARGAGPDLERYPDTFPQSPLFEVWIPVS